MVIPAGEPPPEVEAAAPAPLRARATAGVLWVVVRNWSVQLGSLLLFVVLARLLRPGDFGLVALAAAYLDIADRLVEQGFASAIQQRPVLTDEHLDSAFWMTAGVAALAIIVTLVTAPVMASVTGLPQLTPILRALSLTLVFTSMRSIQDGVLRRELRFKSLAARGVASVVCGGVVGVAMAFAGFGVWSLVGQQLAWEATGVIVMWRAVKWRPAFRVSRAHLRELWDIGAPITATRLLSTTQRRASDFLIGGGLGPVALGYFGIGQRVVGALNRMLSDAVNQVAFPAFSRVSRNPERVVRGYRTATRYIAFAAFPVFLCVAALAPEMVRVGFGEKWVPSIRVVQTLSVMGLVWLIWSFNAAVLQAVGAARVQFWLGLMGTTTNILVIIFALPYGINGVAYAILIRSLIFSPISTMTVRKYIGVRVADLAADFRGPLVGAVASFAAITAVRMLLPGQPPTLILALGILLGGLVYVACIRLLAPGLMQELWSLGRETLTRKAARKAARAAAP